MPLALNAMRKQECAICTIFPEQREEGYYHFEINIPVRALESGSRRGCAFCKVLHDVCRETPLLVEEVYPDGTIHVWCGDCTLHMYPPSSFPKQIELYMPSGELEIEFLKTRKSTWLILMSPDSPFSWLPRLRDISEHTLSDKCHKLLRQWIIKCRDEHESCNLKRLSAIPSRLLDVGTKQSDTVHLIKWESNFSPIYIALSHCWGNSSPSITTKANITQRETEISAADLSRSFQDAVTFARWIGIRHLWIDCLCIVQDDAKDWEKQSAKMAPIYSGAFLVLGATRAANCNEGFLEPREKSWKVGSYTFWNLDFEVHARKYLCHNVRQGNIEAELAESPLFDRGWCFQERMLASRVVHFTSRETIFQCRRSIECQCGGYTTTRGRQSQDNFYHPGVFPSASSHPLERYVRRTHGNNSRIPADVHPAEIDSMRCVQSFIYNVYLWGKENSLDSSLAPIWFGEMWGDMIAEYTQTKLTYSKDILSALSGVASIMRAFSPGRYIAGLWELDLHYQLSWTSILDEADCYRPETYTAPSFTWASRIGPVMFPWQIIITKVCSIVCISCTPKVSDPFGQVSNGFLKLEGKMICGIIGKREGHSGIYFFPQLKDENGNAIAGQNKCHPDCKLIDGKTKFLPPECGFGDEARGIISFDTTAAKAEKLGEKLFCFGLYWKTDLEDRDCNGVSGIVLEMDAEENSYRRVGLGRFPLVCFENVPEVGITII